MSHSLLRCNHFHTNSYFVVRAIRQNLITLSILFVQRSLPTGENLAKSTMYDLEIEHSYFYKSGVSLSQSPEETIIITEPAHCIWSLSPSKFETAREIHYVCKSWNVG